MRPLEVIPCAPVMLLLIDTELSVISMAIRAIIDVSLT